MVPPPPGIPSCLIANWGLALPPSEAVGFLARQVCQIARLFESKAAGSASQSLFNFTYTSTVPVTFQVVDDGQSSGARLSMASLTDWIQVLWQ